MSEEQVPDVEELKARLREEIPVEDDAEDLKSQAGEEVGSMDEALRNLGQQFARAVQSAWHSPQKAEIEKELREGVGHFAQEIEKVFQEAKESPAGQRAQQGTAELKTQVEQKELAQKARNSVVQGLQWLSAELGRLADQFAPGDEKSGGKPPSSSE